MSGSISLAQLPPEEEPPLQQLLVRFRDRTTAIEIPPYLQCTSLLQTWLIQDLSYRFFSTKNPLLTITSWQPPFCQVSLCRSQLLGGKGGFATLLRSQARQAGAQRTTDFGACRDLQGRRLRHVNDEIKLRKWRERQEREKRGETVTDDELFKTPSGIYNWYLQTPTWSDVSQKESRRMQRRYKKITQAERVAVEKKKEQQEVFQNTRTHYLAQATQASEDLQMSSAIQQGLKAQKKRPRIEETLSQQPHALCTLSGDLVVQGSPLLLQSQSEFGTAVLVLDKVPQPNIAYYYEIRLVTGGLAQIGWAKLDEGFRPNNDLGDGVGDDVSSYAVDGTRKLRFHKGMETPYDLEWEADKILGCTWDRCKNTLSYSINGKDCGTAFDVASDALLVPAVSCNGGEILEWHIDKCQYAPPNATFIGELLEHDEKEEAAVQEVMAPPAPKAPKVEAPVTKKKAPVKPEYLDLTPFDSPEALESLGLDRLKSALLFLQVKCG